MTITADIEYGQGGFETLTFHFSGSLVDFDSPCVLIYRIVELRPCNVRDPLHSGASSDGVSDFIDVCVRRLQGDIVSGAASVTAHCLREAARRQAPGERGKGGEGEEKEKEEEYKKKIAALQQASCPWHYRTCKERVTLPVFGTPGGGKNEEAAEAQSDRTLPCPDSLTKGHALWSCPRQY
ncbi:hypothetical protein E2C01_070205 [Portunus trituberculatus]|uniref:Uncharacterized protein n=1 Tax=Portunus trituberculatus TaxID=210409 RepID=A0A5B7I4H5_PORTR|nr:hypothetical protein [Portunus trituberculatus]